MGTEVSSGTLSLKVHGRVLPGRALGVWWLLAIPVSLACHGPTPCCVPESMGLCVGDGNWIRATFVLDSKTTSS